MSRSWLPRFGLSCVGGLLAVLICPLSANGQSSPQERREQLAKVQEQLADPDPLMRLAYMEDIVASGDALRLQVAMRSAFASDDLDLRALALPAYLASHKEFTFDIALPPALQKVADSRTQSTAAEIDKQYPFVRALSDNAFKLHIVIKQYKIGENAGVLTVYSDANFTITGDRLSTLVNTGAYGNCYIDFNPTRRQMLEGTMACNGPWPKLAIAMRAF